MSTAVPVSDSGSGSDALSSIIMPVADSATGTQTASVFATAPIPDSATGAEALSGSTTLGLTDPGAGSETLPISATFGLATSGAGADAVSSIIVQLGDTSATGSDAASVNVNPNLFAIAFYTSQNGTTVSGGFNLNVPETQQNPYAGTYGGTYVLTWFEGIRQPNSVQMQMAPSLGIDLGGAPVVRQYDVQHWTFNRIRPADYQVLQSLYRLMRRTAGTPYAGKVRIRWPDPESGQLITASARWSPLPTLERDWSGWQNITLTFTNLGRDDASFPTGTGIWLPSAA